MSNHQEQFEDTIKNFVDEHHASLEGMVKNQEFYNTTAIAQLKKNHSEIDLASYLIEKNVGKFAVNKQVDAGKFGIVIDIGFKQLLRISHGDNIFGRVDSPMMIQPLIEPIKFGNYVIDVVPFVPDAGFHSPSGRGLIETDVANLCKHFMKREQIPYDVIKSNNFPKFDNFGVINGELLIIRDIYSVMDSKILKTNPALKVFVNTDKPMERINEFISKFSNGQSLSEADYQKAWDGHRQKLGLTQGEVKGHITLDQLNNALKEHPQSKLLNAMNKDGVYGQTLYELGGIEAQRIIAESNLPDEQKQKLWRESIAQAKNTPPPSERGK